MGPQLVSLGGFSWNSGYSHCWVAPTHVSQWKNINHCKEKVRFKAGPCLRKTGHHRQDVLQEQISLGEEELNSVFGTYSECWIILSSTLHCYLQSLGDSRLKRTRMSTMKVTVLFFFLVAYGNNFKCLFTFPLLIDVCIPQPQIKSTFFLKFPNDLFWLQDSHLKRERENTHIHKLGLRLARLAPCCQLVLVRN